MKDRQPWSVRGVTREARAKAARAASQQHQTIGEWVTQTLIAAADRDLGLASDAPAPADAPATNLPARQEGQQKELTQAASDRMMSRTQDTKLDERCFTTVSASCSESPAATRPCTFRFPEDW
jgi:hypothetical protein